MTCTEAIRFRQLNDELTDEEFDHFTKSIGRDLLTKCLFSYFQTNSSTAHSVNKTQHKIIESRPTLPDHETTYQCIDQLPSELINNTASFLQSAQYFRFARCNRKLYVSCFFPPMLQQLIIKLSAKPFAKLFTPNALNLAPNVRDLRIKNADMHFYEESYFDKSFFLNGLSKFKAIEHLEMNNVDINNPGNMQVMKQWFPMLKSLLYSEMLASPGSIWLDPGRTVLRAHENVLAGMLINTFQDQLEIIRLVKYWGMDEVRVCERMISEGATFPKLQSLTVNRYTNVFRNVTSLRKYYTTARDLSAEHMDYIFQQQPNLELVVIYSVDVGSTVFIMEKLESALMRSQHVMWKCKHLTVSVMFDGLEEGCLNISGEHVIRMCDAFKGLKISHWTLIVKLDDVYDSYSDENIQSLKSAADAIKGNYFVSYFVNPTHGSDRCVELSVSNTEL
eukprot:187638_1